MNSGLYTFDQLILDIKDDTGYSNLTNRFSEIKRMILRAERSINPFSSALIRKKMKLYSSNDNFDGVRFRKEEDFMFLDKVGCCAEGLCEGSFYETLSHIILCDGETRTEITYVYWAIRTDDNGNPFTTYNHSEAVVKFIVWKLTKQKYMLGEKGLRDVSILEAEFEDEAAYSRGNDFFPSEQALQKMLVTNQTEKMVLFTEFVRGEDGCIECSCIETSEEVDLSLSTVTIWSYQIDDAGRTEEVVVDQAWLEANGTEQSEAEMLAGKNIEQILVGRIGFGILTETEEIYRIVDALNNDITETVFNRTYNAGTNLELYKSETIYAPGSLYFKFIK